MDRFLASPVRRSALIAGQLVSGASTTALQTVLVFAVGMAAGARTTVVLPATWSPSR